MKGKYLIDIGSSTVKVYENAERKIKLIDSKTFDFKKSFSSMEGISAENKILLYSYIRKLCDIYGLTKVNTKLFATGIFRKLAQPEEFIGDFYEITGLYFNIISQELEAFYLEKAWLGKCNNLASVLVINIGGETTELLFYKKGSVEKKELLSVGVGTILKKYPFINSTCSAADLKVIVKDICIQLPNVSDSFQVAIYTGGELDYMRIAGYPLHDNHYFIDEKHPVFIEATNYYGYNEKIFSDYTIEKLRELMPNNPDWMNGARACSALAQAICMHYSVESIIPSNSNLIDGAILQEARSVVLCGSFNKHLNKITKLMSEFEKKGIAVLSPSNTTVIGEQDGFVLFDGDVMINNCKWSVERKHIKAIKECDMVVICNYDGYCGHSTGYEWARADGFGKKVVFLEDNELAQSLDFPFEIGLL